MENYDIEKLRRERDALRKYAIIQKAQEERVCVQKVYIDMTDDLESALVLDELIFFTLPRDGGRSALRIWKDGVLWMAVQRTEWWERKRLKPRQADLAIEKLKEQELIFSSVHKFNGVNTVHIRLNVEKFFQRLAELLEQQNPPENESDTTQMDLDDLYEMMGKSRLQNGDLEQSRLQNGDEGLRNGEILNIPHNNPNINNPQLSSEQIQEIIQSANRTMDGILELNKGAEKSWKGREFFRDNLLEYADWYHGKTNQVCNKHYQKSWQKAFSEWQDAELKIEHLLEAYNQDVGWKKFITDPNELTKKAIAIKAAYEVKPAKAPKADDDGFEFSNEIYV